jgi:hypothetical protein
MESADKSRPLVRAGDLDGLGRVYSEWGSLIARSEEKTLATGEGWEMNIRSPWRTVFPRTVFPGFGGTSSSRLFVTTERIVLVRDINVWRELKDELSPLGVPTAAAKEIRLQKLKAAGARQYCEIRPRDFRVVKLKKSNKRSSWLDLRLIGSDARRYAITAWKTNGADTRILSIIESQFKR